MSAAHSDTTLDQARAALGACERLVHHVLKGDSDRATRLVEQAIAALANVVADYRLDLCEVLPEKPCSRCGRGAVDYRTVGNERVCILCAQEHAARASETVELPSRASVLDAARLAVMGRAEQHGPPAPSFRRVAALWSTILGHEVQPHQIALCMVALKIARLVERPRHVDSWVDVAGYGACGAEVASATPGPVTATMRLADIHEALTSRELG